MLLRCCRLATFFVRNGSIRALWDSGAIVQKLFSSFFLLLLAGNSAMARDDAKRLALAYNGPIPSEYVWTGWYAGANIGGSFGRSSTDFTIAGVPFGSMSPKMDGVLGGLQAGYNWQIGRAVLGWETDFGATGQRSTSSLIDFIPGVPGVPGTPGVACIFEDGPGTPCRPGTGIPGTPGIPAIPAVTGLVTYQNKLPWFGTVRGRVGFAATDRWLAYLTGGLAYADVSTSETLVVGGVSSALITDSIRIGWTIGGGIETVLWSGWTAKLEYLYLDFGTVNNSLIGIAPITPIATSTHVTDQIVRVGLNYRFNSAGTAH